MSLGFYRYDSILGLRGEMVKLCPRCPCRSATFWMTACRAAYPCPCSLFSAEWTHNHDKLEHLIGLSR